MSLLSKYFTNVSNLCRAVNLEVLSFSHTTNVVKDFFEEIRNMMSSAESSAPPLSYSLKTLFLPVADGTDLEGVIRQVREICTDMQKKVKAMVRDIAPRGQTENATRGLRSYLFTCISVCYQINLAILMSFDTLIFKNKMMFKYHMCAGHFLSSRTSGSGPPPRNSAKSILPTSLSCTRSCWVDSALTGFSKTSSAALEFSWPPSRNKFHQITEDIGYWDCLGTRAK